MRPDDEEELAGGNLTRVVRVGATVRRAAGPWTEMVHQLLVHVRTHGFELGPEPLGFDTEGREVLSFLEGETLAAHPWPAWTWSDHLLVEAAGALAAYHRAVATFRPPLVRSRLGTGVLADDELVCHNDLAPYNCVFRHGHLTGVLDWDVVCAGRPVWDLAFLAWQWVPLHAPSPELAWRTTDACRRRLRLALDAYGHVERSGFVASVLERIEASRVGILERADAGDAAFVRLADDGHADEMARAIEFVAQNAVVLTDALSG